MLSNNEKAARLRQAIDALDQANGLVQEALGSCDFCYETHNRIQDIIDDLEADVVDLVMK